MTVIVTVEGMPMSVAVEIPKGKPLHPNGPKRVRVVRSDAAPPPPEITARFDWGYRNTEHRIPETDEGLDPFRGLAPLAMQVEFESDKIYGRWVYPYPSDPVWRGQEKIYAKYGYPPVSSRQPKCELRFPGAADLLYVAPKTDRPGVRAHDVPKRLHVFFGQGLVYHGEFASLAGPSKTPGFQGRG